MDLTQKIEIAVAEHFNYRINTIVPNIHWGMGLKYEADLVVLRKSGFAIEVEIKTNRADVLRDLSKTNWHNSNLFRQLYFAIPMKIAIDCVDIIPLNAGILAVDLTQNTKQVKLLRTAKINKNFVKWSDKKKHKLAKLGCMRIWSLKKHLSLEKGF